MAEVLEAYKLLLDSMYLGAELPENAEGYLEALGWVLGVPTSNAVFLASIAQVQESLRTATYTITNAREQQGES